MFLWCMRFMRGYRLLHLLPVLAILGAHTQGRGEYHTHNSMLKAAHSILLRHVVVHLFKVASQEAAICVCVHKSAPLTRPQRR